MAGQRAGGDVDLVEQQGRSMGLRQIQRQLGIAPGTGGISEQRAAETGIKGKGQRADIGLPLIERQLNQLQHRQAQQRFVAAADQHVD